LDTGWSVLDHGAGAGLDSDRGCRVQEQVGRRLAVGNRVCGEPDVIREKMIESGEREREPRLLQPTLGGDADLQPSGLYSPYRLGGARYWLQAMPECLGALGLVFT
jgi:hypothetical protein